MLVWFACIAALGVYGITRHPSVAVAINPFYGVGFWQTEAQRASSCLAECFFA